LSFFTGDSVETRYTFIFGTLVGSGYESNANVGFLTDGFVNGRVFGMIAVGTAAAVTIGVLAGLSVISRSLMGLLYLINLSQVYAEAAIQQVLLTGGALIVFVVLTLRTINVAMTTDTAKPLTPRIRQTVS
jgi:hypothetical protein